MTKWSKFWTLKVFKTVSHWSYQTNNPIKVTPRSDQNNPKAARKVSPMINQRNPKQWHPTSLLLLMEFFYEWTTLNLNEQKLCCAFFLLKSIFGNLVGSCIWTLVLSFDYSNLGFIINIPDAYFIYIISSSLVSFTNHVHKNFVSIVWFCCQVSGHATDKISSYDLSWHMLLFFGMKTCINTSVF